MRFFGVLIGPEWTDCCWVARKLLILGVSGMTNPSVLMGRLVVSGPQKVLVKFEVTHINSDELFRGQVAGLAQEPLFQVNFSDPYRF